jgi:uncharacterized protein
MMDNRLISYLYFFNVQQDYYECHEYGEHLWLELGRPEILKGLIQSAVCLYHLHNGNLRGASIMWNRAKTYLKAGMPSYQDIDIATLIRDIDEVFDMVLSKFQSNMVTPEMILRLQLPKVKIQILNSELYQTVQDWKPKPLDIEHE